MIGENIRIAIVTALVVLWRLVALSWPNSFVNVDESLQLPLTLLGFVYLGCGLAAWIARPGRWARLLFVVGAAGGLHWGGAIGFGTEAADLGLLLAYLGVSVVGDAALLHLAIVYPLGSRVTPPLLVALYAPAVAAIAAAPLVSFIPRGSIEPAIGILMQLATAFALVAGLIFVVQTIRLHGEMRRAARLIAIVAAFVVGGGLTLAAGSGMLPDPAEAWNLAAVAIPFSLAYALITTPLETPD